MMQKLFLILLTTALLFGLALTAVAQNVTGSISGTVYLSENPNGSCTEANLQGESGITIQVVNVDDNTTINLTTDNTGTYEFVTSNLGTWRVTVNPGSSYRVLTQQTRQVVISEQNPDHEDIDFCIFADTSTPTPTVTPSQTPISTPNATPIPTPTPIQPVLPESGAPAAPSLVIAAGLGILFIITGLFIFARSR
jgi:hypothetical protein